MRKLLAILALLSGCFTLPSDAYLLQVPAAAGPTFSGPCDVANANCTAGWAIGALTGAYAAAHGNDFIIKRTSDSTTCTVKVNSAGAADLTSATNCTGSLTAQAWATRGTFTGATISGTTLSFTGSSGTFTSGDQIIGTGVSANTTISGTCTTSPCTITPSQTVASATTITDLIPVFITQVYDQIGSIALTNAATSLKLIWNCNNSLPCIQNTANNVILVAAGNYTPVNTTVSFSTVGDRETFVSANDFWIMENASTNNNMGTNGSANTWRSVGGGTANGTYAASDGVWHSVQVVNGGSVATCVGTGANCVNVDGTETATSTHAPNQTAGKPSVLQDGSGSTLRWTAGFFSDNASVWSSTTRAAVCASERSIYATAGSC